MEIYNKRIHQKLIDYRFEFLLAALLFLLFDKILFPDNTIFLKYIWPVNMIFIAAACFGIFKERSKRINVLKNIFSFISILMPIGFLFLSQKLWFIELLTVFFILYYVFIFIEVMRQITKAREIRINVIIGSFCGYMILSLVALFSYLIIELNFHGSFHGITQNNISQVYNELSYFSFITLTSIGFGDIYPITDMSRLVVAFFGMAGQFYMVAVVGIIISRFASK